MLLDFGMPDDDKDEPPPAEQRVSVTVPDGMGPGQSLTVQTSAGFVHNDVGGLHGRRAGAKRQRRHATGGRAASSYDA